eukprot:scaffold141336_cov205-Phaeocystis_antarctica.AAC.1
MYGGGRKGEVSRLVLDIKESWQSANKNAERRTRLPESQRSPRGRLHSWCALEAKLPHCKLCGQREGLVLVVLERPLAPRASRAPLISRHTL